MGNDHGVHTEPLPRGSNWRGSKWFILTIITIALFSGSFVPLTGLNTG